MVPEDIKEVAHCVMCHRLIGEFDEVQKKVVVTNILNSVELPTEDWSKR